MKYFGTDGIRGLVNEGNFTVDFLVKIAVALVRYFDENGAEEGKIVIASDTRISCDMIKSTMTGVFLSKGINVLDLGILPSPALSMMVKYFKADFGVMISASHNPYEYNGVKVFDCYGQKIFDEAEKRIEELIDGDFKCNKVTNRIGRIVMVKNSMRIYIKNLPAINMNNLKIAIDCANGAAYRILPKILPNAVKIGVKPNGININKNCGSTDIRKLSEIVIKNGCDVGVALDGDADRLIIVDEKGEEVDGDYIMANIVRELKFVGKLQNDKMVVTIMSSLAFEKYLKSIEIDLIRVGVGDKNILDQILRHKYSFGGEQSGHIIINDNNNFAPAGDGIKAAIYILNIISKVKNSEKVSEILRPYKPPIQIKENFHYKNPNLLDILDIKNKIEELQMRNDVRIVVRKSGTEPLIRFMVEAENFGFADRVLRDMVKMVRFYDNGN